MNRSTTFQPSKIGQNLRFWWGLRARERNASSNWMDPQENEKKKSKRFKFLKRCTQEVQLSKAATEVPGAPPHCTSASVFQTTSITFFLHLMKISLQPHTLFLNSWVRTFAKTPQFSRKTAFFTFSAFFFDGLIWRQWSFWHLYVEGYMVRLTQRSTTAEVPTICAPISTSSLLIFSYFSYKNTKTTLQIFHIFHIFFK